MLHKSFKFEIKELSETGKFTGYASTFGNVDRGGDMVKVGAFNKTLEDKAQHPILWQHNSGEPLGLSEKSVPDEKGLLITGQLNMDVQSAREKYSLMKQGVIKGISMGYETVRETWQKSVRILEEVKLGEYSLCIFPMNERAQVTSVKADDIEPILEAILDSPLEAKPYPNEHAARLRDPDDFDPDTFRRTQGGTIYGKLKVPATISIIWGKLKDSSAESDPPIPQALRFPTKDWTVEEAKSWLKDNSVKAISFEPASEKMVEQLEMSIKVLQSLLDKREPISEVTPEFQEPIIKGLDNIEHELKALLSI